MFTGKIETFEPILRVSENQNKELRIFVKRPRIFKKLKIGDSLSVNGACLTLEAKTKDTLQFFLSQKTLRTTLWNKKNLKKKKVNLERSLKFSDPMHGHLVTGHVQATGSVFETKSLKQTLILFIQFPSQIKNYIFENASIAIDGVSLTIDKIYKSQFTVHIIPETLKKTNLSYLKKKDHVNLETDFMIQCVFKALERKSAFLKKDLIK